MTASLRWRALTRGGLGSPVNVRISTLIGVLVLCAFALRLYGLGTRSLYGDEYSTLLEGQQLGRNYQSLLYFAGFHFWLLLGASDFWVRFPSVIFGVLAIPVSYQLGRRAVSQQTGIVLAFLLSFSAFALQYSQETRFYSLFLLSTLLAQTAFLELQRHPTVVRLRLMWLGACLLVTFSHLLGFLVPLCQVIAWWISSSPDSRRLWRWLVALGGLLTLVGLMPLLMTPSSFKIVQQLIGGHNLSLAQVQPRGLSVINFAKIPIALFFFSLGESQSALNLPYSLVGIVLFACAGILGLWALRGKSQTLTLSLATLLPLAFVFLVLDPSAPAYTETASSRHVTMVLPSYLLFVAAGITAYRWQGMLMAAVGAVALYSALFYFSAEPLNWKQVAQFVVNNSNPGSIVLFDGRSSDPVTRYFGPAFEKLNNWEYLHGQPLPEIARGQQVVFIASDIRSAQRKELDNLLGELEQNLALKTGTVRYPTFVYVFNDKGADWRAGYPVNSVTNQIMLPSEIYGLEFQDLILPTQAVMDGLTYEVIGSFQLPNLEGARERVIPLLNAPISSGIVVLSNVTGGAKLRQGETIAELSVTGMDGLEHTFPLRLGSETQEWGEKCASQNGCQTALAWYKKRALVGQYAYEGAWSDFEARIFGTELNLPHPQVVKSITVRYIAGTAQLHVWGMALR